MDIKPAREDRNEVGGFDEISGQQDRIEKMDNDVISILLGVVTGCVIAAISSLLIPLFMKRMEVAEKRRGIYEIYTQPLAADAVNLLWRLDEILFRKRGQYLLEDAPPTFFNQYKRISTCYRLAVIIGWIRAIRLEQSYLFYGDQAAVDALRRAIVGFESALADSPRVEIGVVSNLARLWKIELPDEAEMVAFVAAQVVAEMQRFLSKNALARYHELAGLEAKNALELVQYVAGSVTRTLNHAPIAEQVLIDTYPAALKIIGVRQAWIYRDWQQAIGDVMIREVEGRMRRFDVIGYSAFSQGQSPWFDRLWDLVKGIDVREPEGADLRLQQLRLVARATASLVCSIESLHLERRIVDPQACQLARKFLAELPPMAEAA